MKIKELGLLCCQKRRALGNHPGVAGPLGEPDQAFLWIRVVDHLTAGQTLEQVAQGIAGSQENNTQLINDDYFHYLGRTADTGGLDFWLSQFAVGKTNEDVIAGFTGSAEYYKQHTGA